MATLKIAAALLLVVATLAAAQYGETPEETRANKEQLLSRIPNITASMDTTHVRELVSAFEAAQRAGPQLYSTIRALDKSVAQTVEQRKIEHEAFQNGAQSVDDQHKEKDAQAVFEQTLHQAALRRKSLTAQLSDVNAMKMAATNTLIPLMDLANERLRDMTGMSPPPSARDEILYVKGELTKIEHVKGMKAQAEAALRAAEKAVMANVSATEADKAKAAADIAKLQEEVSAIQEYENKVLERWVEQKIKNFKFVAMGYVNATEYNCPTSTSTCTAKTPDVNGDGSVNVLDIIHVRNRIMEDASKQGPCNICD